MGKSLQLSHQTSVAEFVTFVESFGGSEVDLETGEYGMILIHRLLQEGTEEGFTAFMGAPVPIIEGARAYTQYSLPSGVLTLIHNPDYDKPDKDGTDPTTGFPITSLTLYHK